MFHNNELTQDIGVWLSQTNASVLSNLISLTYFDNSNIFGSFPTDISINFSNILLYGGSDGYMNGNLPSNVRFSNPKIQSIMVCFVVCVCV